MADAANQNKVTQARPQSIDCSEPVAFAGACGSATKVGHVTPAGVAPAGAGGGGAASSLDTQETSVKISGDTILHEPQPGPYNGEAPALTPDQAFRHGGWEPVRSRVRAALYKTAQPSHRIEAFDLCGACAWIEQNVEHPSQFRIKSSYCHDRLCTPCANERAWRLRDALLEQIGKSKVTFITLTLCGKGEGLRDLIDRLYKSFRALRIHPTWADKVRGGAAFLEIKWSDKAGRWHPHLHIICDADYVPQCDLSNAWRSITKDSFIVDIQRVKTVKTTAAYVAKYASKPLNMSFARSPALLEEAVVALKMRRLCLTFGTWYGTPLDAAEDAPLDDELEFLNWRNIGGLYELHQKACDGCLASQTALAAVRAYERIERFRSVPDTS